MWILFILPERVLYLISDLFYVITYRVAGYRKAVVRGNLERSFPEMEAEMIVKVMKKFYHHFCDLMLETAISHFFTPESGLKRISYENPELLDELYRKGKIILGVTAHYGNWEYLSTLPLVTEIPVNAIYKPLKNRYFDRMVIESRSRLGVKVVTMEKITRELIAHHRENHPVMSLVLADQRPPYQNIQYWTRFLNQDTPMFLGTEKLSKKLDAAVVFIKIRKASRGHYRVEFQLITDRPETKAPFEITNDHVRILEDMIREAPEYWLWSHKRWKYSYERYLKERGEKTTSEQV
jgi:KDO2-lipid IV(A) lauroyltransferase